MLIIAIILIVNYNANLIISNSFVYKSMLFYFKIY